MVSYSPKDPAHAMRVRSSSNEDCRGRREAWGADMGVGESTADQKWGLKNAAIFRASVMVIGEYLGDADDNRCVCFR